MNTKAHLNSSSIFASSGGSFFNMTIANQLDAQSFHSGSIRMLLVIYGQPIFLALQVPGRMGFASNSQLEVLGKKMKVPPKAGGGILGAVEFQGFCSYSNPMKRTRVPWKQYKAMMWWMPLQFALLWQMCVGFITIPVPSQCLCDGMLYGIMWARSCAVTD